MKIKDNQDLPSLLTLLYGEEDAPAQGHLDLLIHLAAAFQFREKGVVDHLRRVAAYVELLARALHRPEGEVLRLKHACVFHDVGMVDVPEAILKKEGSLTDQEMGVLRRHTALGRDLLQRGGFPFLLQAGMVAWCHHERYDGTGYPRRLAGEQIPLGARILAIADVFDALTTARPFKGAYPVSVAVEMIHAKAGSHFDPRVVDQLLGRIGDFEDVCASMTTPPQREFRLSARDSSEGDLSFLPRTAYFACPFCHDLHPREQSVCPATAIALEGIHKLSGAVLGEKYLIGEPLGMGAMGVVYRATHLLIQRQLAVKLLLPRVADSRENLTRFFNEARVFSAVGHPNLVEITDMGWTHDGIPYFTMELLDGVSLARLILKAAPLPSVLVLPIMIEILRTLEAVHRKGIVHRDLKPENIFLVHQGQDTVGLKVMDFGVSHLEGLQGDQSRLTQPGLVFGTPQYMSPEQAEGREDLDGRSDLFALGSILYEMVTGLEAFPGDYPVVMMDIYRGRYIRPRVHNPQLAPELEEVIVRALQVDPALRYQDAREFIIPLMALSRREGGYEEGRIPLRMEGTGKRWRSGG